MRVSEDPAFQELADFRLELKRSKVDPKLLKKFHKRLELLRLFVTKDENLLSYVSTMLAVNSIGIQDVLGYRKMERNKMTYPGFKEMRLTELCNDCEAIMAGKLHYGTPCKRCQAKYDAAARAMAGEAGKSLAISVKGFFSKLFGE